MILKLGMKHQAMELYKDCINRDPGMTLTFLRQGQLRPPMHLNGKKLMAKDLSGISKPLKIFFSITRWPMILKLGMKH